MPYAKKCAQLNSIKDEESEGIKNYANSPRAVCAQKSLLLQWKQENSRSVLRKKKKAPVCAFGNMLKSFMYIKNYKRIILILAAFLLYISMYLIHNAYGTLCIIKSSSGDKGSKGDIEVSKLYKANNSNLFVSNVHNISLSFYNCLAATRCCTKKIRMN